MDPTHSLLEREVDVGDGTLPGHRRRARLGLRLPCARSGRAPVITARLAELAPPRPTSRAECTGRPQWPHAERRGSLARKVEVPLPTLRGWLHGRVGRGRVMADAMKPLAERGMRQVVRDPTASTSSYARWIMTPWNGSWSPPRSSRQP